MNKNIIFGLLIVLLCATVSADWYYQEVGDEFGEDGNWNTPALLNDSDWSTKDRAAGGDSADMYENYTSYSSLYNYTIQTKWSTATGVTIRNFTVSDYDCVTNPIQVWGRSGSAGHIKWFCMNTTVWVEMYDFASVQAPYIYETGLYAQINYTNAVDNCSTNNHTIINFTLYDSNRTAITGSMGGHVTLEGSQAFNLTWKDAEYFEVCFKGGWLEFMHPTFNGQFEYSATGYDTETYYISESTLDNTTDNIALYLDKENSTTTVAFTVTDENDNPVEDVYINVMEYDVTTDTATTTELINTNSDGEAIASIILDTQRYKFILTYNGVVYLETSDLILTGTSYGFRINLGENFYDNYDIVMGTSCSVTFSNVTKLFEFTWVDSTTTTSSGCLRVVKTSMLGDDVLYDSCVTSYTGTISYNVTTSTGNNTYVGAGSIYVGGKEYLCDSAEYNYDNTYKSYGLTGVFATFMLILTLILIGAWHPGVAIVLSIVVVMMSTWMHFFYLGWGSVIGLVIIGALTVYRLNK